MKREGLVSFEVRHKETDLFILAKRDLAKEVSSWIIEARAAIEEYAMLHPGFLESLIPYPDDNLAPEPVKQMLKASKMANVGPMAAVAGAISEFVAQKILDIFHGEVIVENGGDIALYLEQPIVIGIYAGNSPFSNKIGIKLEPMDSLFAICTSSGTVGHSKSFGKADAVTVIAKSASFADALATAIGNKVLSKYDIDPCIKEMQKYSQDVLGGVIIKADAIGAFGRLELVPL